MGYAIALISGIHRNLFELLLERLVLTGLNKYFEQFLH